MAQRKMLKEEIINVDSDNNKYINILLFSETGVGKSTFINALANYLNYSDLKTAMRYGLEIIIPSKFTMLDQNYEEKVVKLGSDDNECTEAGASATQYCKSYLFPIKQRKVTINFIDTPGIADTRGVNKDNSNLEQILSFISDMKHLNAICVLLKPNVSRLTVQFEYCIKQLLSRLDRSASNNLIFVFTNTRSTFYRPGETLPCLRELFKGIHNVTIPLSKKNMFCLDNEAFRFLAAYKSGIKFDSETVNTFSESWCNSSREIWRMIDYIIGGGPNNNAALEPHLVESTISINESRRLIFQLSRPMAEIAQLIQTNIWVLNEHTDSLTSSSKNVKKLKKKLYIPFINLKVDKLNYPATVCTSPDCTELYQVNDVKRWHYKQRCHDPCYLKNVPDEIVGSPELTRCAAMQSAGNNCIKCNCSYKIHMHIYYNTTTVEDRIEDKDVQKKIKKGQKVTEAAKDIIEKTKCRIEEYMKERDIILKTTAKFAHFLQQNAITPYNDAYKSYLEYLIDRENSRGIHADRKILSEFTEMLKQYEEEKQILNNALNQPGHLSSTITAADIIDNINRLYSLKHTGKKIEEMIASQNDMRKKELRSETNQYIHSTRKQV